MHGRFPSVQGVQDKLYPKRMEEALLVQSSQRKPEQSIGKRKTGSPTLQKCYSGDD